MNEDLEKELKKTWDKVADSRDYVSHALTFSNWSEALAWARRMYSDLSEFIYLLEKTEP